MAPKATLPRASQMQVKAASAILKQFSTTHGGSASDTVLANAVYSLYAALGGPGYPAAEYADAVAQATGNEMKLRPMILKTGDGFEVTGENPMGLSVGKVYVDVSKLEGGDENDFEETKSEQNSRTPTTPADNKEPDNAQSELASVTELNKMKKADLLAVAELEKVENVSPDTTNDEIVKAILANRE